MTRSSVIDRGNVLENAGGSRHFSLASPFHDAPGRTLTDDRIVLVLLLLSTLVVVSCATLLDRASAPSIAAVEPAPVRELAPATTAPAEPRPLEPPPARQADPLAERHLTLPVRGVDARALRDNFDSRRGRRLHHALDIMAPRGTPVIAADDGRIAKVYRHALGGLSIYQYDPDERFSYYYAHMDRFADGLREGDTVKRGDILGYVGTTGNATPASPHLHFAVSRLGDDRKWWRGTPVNPYPYLAAPG
jgi:murein DD-endopeptidase MepM/ murein hydrolase activator NlpD